MPIPRMTTTFASKGTFASGTTFAEAENTGSRKATIVQVSAETGNKYYLMLDNGFITSAAASIDAPLQVGDVVYVQKAMGSWVITGTA